MYFARNYNNMCEIATYAMYPTVNITNSTAANISPDYEYIYSDGATVHYSLSLMANLSLFFLYFETRKYY